MARYMPALRLPALRTGPKELQDTDTQRERYDGLAIANHSRAQSQISPDSPSLSISTHDYLGISSLPRSPASKSPVSSHGGLSSPTSSVASSTTSRSRLRRKITPTETSLREIRASQQLLQMKQSEDQLRELYERQTMEYLYGDYASLDGLRE